MMKSCLLFCLLVSVVACSSETKNEKDEPIIFINNGSTISNNTSSSSNNGTTNGTSGSNNDTTPTQTQSDCEGRDTEVDGVCELVNYVRISASASVDNRPTVMRRSLSTSVCTINASAPIPPPLTFRFDDGVCQVFFYEDGTIPGQAGRSMDAGEVTLRKSSGDIVYKPNAESSCYDRVGAAQSPGFTIGEKIEVSAKGGADFEAFTTNFTAPTHLSGVTFGPFDPNAGLEVSWDSRDELWASVILIAISVDPEEKSIAIFCINSEQTGSLTIAKEAIELLHPDLLRLTATVTVSENQNQKIGNTVVRLSKIASQTSEIINNTR